ncbi:peptidylprolyl isomerase [Sphingomonas corticis]|jgi:peptidylprolyl isomerase|uniref:peptidylprolyl isomerase n=1 Tax=Sphingomonas corticis TaxID=2722791 RepID=A0ABX1CTX7_9SPHN|nr:peptidylprolyl isomerase [Sphingomonas corticis]NJR80261.1 peptidylprolyl isomerase [Sphingomonas corticis]
MLLLPLLAPVQAVAPATPPAPHDPLPADWRAIPDDEVMIVTLAGGRTVVVRLAATYAPLHVENIRRLARARWWDGASVYRVQENWVAQWGDATEKKPLPVGVAVSVPPEFETQAPAAAVPAARMARADTHSTFSGITADGWPVGADGAGHQWLTHCYGMVGVARDADPTSGTGAELFTPIGQSARRLDRNYAVAGRVIEGMKWLSALPRSDAPLGVYPTAEERLPIVSAVLASDLPAAARPRFQYRAADNPRFLAALRRRENPPAPTIGSGAIDVCEMPLETRRQP